MVLLAFDIVPKLSTYITCIAPCKKKMHEGAIKRWYHGTKMFGIGEDIANAILMQIQVTW